MSGPNHPRGTTNRDDRGSSTARRRRREFLVAEFGFVLHGQEVVRCVFCAGLLTVDTVSCDRWPVPGWRGGRYTRDNIRPACVPCNASEGSRSMWDRRREAAAG